MAVPHRQTQTIKHQRELARIDTRIRRLWADHRQWLQDGLLDTNYPDVTQEIDALLDERHRLTLNTQGEMRHTDDIASVAEWGELGLGT
jgi:hypothetical protein